MFACGVSAGRVAHGVALCVLLAASQAIAQDAQPRVTTPTFTIGAAQMPAATRGSRTDVSAQARRRFTEYLGGGYLTLSDSCADFGWTGTHQIMVRAQPQGLPGNDRNLSQLALFFATGTIAMKYDASEMQMDGVEVEEASYVWNGPWIPQIPSMTISYRARYGDSLQSGDEDLSSVMLIFGNFNEHDGCTATARVSLGRI